MYLAFVHWNKCACISHTPLLPLYAGFVLSYQIIIHLSNSVAFGNGQSYLVEYE